MRVTVFLVPVLLVAAMGSARPAFATAGLAEWEIRTPGGSLISHVDPYIQANGTCLRSAKPDAIYVSHIEWWRGYGSAVTGKARRGYFLFSETARTVTFFGSEEELSRAIAGRRLGAATSRRMTPGDGWRQVWGPMLLERCRQLEASSNGAEVDPAIKAATQKMCSEFRAQAGGR